LAKYKSVRPHEKDLVVDLYSSRLSMRSVSEMTGISKSKVYEILHEADSPDKQIFRCHDLRSNLYKAGISLRDYADLIRAKNIFIKEGIQPEKVLKMIREVIILCFRTGTDPQMLVSFFDDFRQFVYSLAREFPENLETKMESELKYLETKVNDLAVVLAKCGQLRNAIILLEKLANNSKNYTHNDRSL
jgi:hypothetical protein